MIDIALKMLLHDRMRFGITLLGVAFAVALILIQTGLFIGILSNASVTIEHARADLWVTARNTPNIDFPQSFPGAYVQRVRSVPGVARADNLILAYLNLAMPTGAKESIVGYAMEDFQAWNLPWNVGAGDLADLRRGRYFFLDDSARRRLGSFEVGDYREVAGQRLKILGWTRDARSFTTTPVGFLDLRLAQELDPRLQGQATYILVRLEPGADVEAVRREIRRRLPYNDVHTREEWSRKSRDYWIDNTGIGFNMVLTVFLGCLVGVVVVAQTLYTSTMEHLREFGTLKAIGGSNADIYRILGRQASISAGLGYLLGVVPSLLARPFVERADLKLILEPKFLLIVLVGTLGMCLVAALVSFRKVAAIDPALVFRG